MPPISKPEPRKRVKARTQRQHAAARKACQDVVWERARHCCEICGRWLKKPRETDSVLDVGHVHEIVYRSQGGSDTDPLNCMLLCPEDHERIHLRRFTDAPSCP